MKLYSLELVIFGWLAYNIFVEIHDWLAESFDGQDNEQVVIAPKPVAPFPNVK